VSLQSEKKEKIADKYINYVELRDELLKADIKTMGVVDRDKHELELNLCNHHIRRIEAMTSRVTPKGEIFAFNGLKLYKTDPVAFIELELHIFNPDLEPANIPFHLFKYQRDFVYKDLYPAYLKKDSILDEKTRQMGLSWLYCAFSLWGILFDRGFTGFMLSKKEALVDDGGDKSTKDSLFGKIRYMYDTLSDEFKAQYKAFMSSPDGEDILAF